MIRLDSYKHYVDSVSRGNSQLAELEPSAVFAYLNEHVAKYSPGEAIARTDQALSESLNSSESASTATGSWKFPCNTKLFRKRF